MYRMVSSVRRIYGELYVIKLGTETNLGGTKMKLGTSEIHTINEHQGSSKTSTIKDGDAREAWTRLEKKYEKKTAPSRLILKKQFVNSK